MALILPQVLTVFLYKELDHVGCRHMDRTPQSRAGTTQGWVKGQESFSDSDKGTESAGTTCGLLVMNKCVGISLVSSFIVNQQSHKV